MVASRVESVAISPPIVRAQRVNSTNRVTRRERSRAEAASESPLREVDADEVLKLLGIGRNVNVLA